MVARAPRPAVLCLIAAAGCAAAAGSFALALTSDHVAEPGLQAALMVWMALPYVLAGVVAWWRRPESRFGPLMVVAGSVGLLATLGWSNAALPFTIGQALDLVPAVLFLHLFLAFPTGRLERRLERVIVALGYFTAFGLELVGMLLGGFGPDNLHVTPFGPVGLGLFIAAVLLVVRDPAGPRCATGGLRNRGLRFES